MFSSKQLAGLRCRFYLFLSKLHNGIYFGQIHGGKLFPLATVKIETEYLFSSLVYRGDSEVVIREGAQTLYRREL